MAVAFDAATNGLGGGFTHTPVGTPRGVLIIIRMLNAGDNVTTVTYGGVSCTETANSPLLASGAEGGSIHAFFLGSSIPTGAQTCDVTTTTGVARTTCYTVTAAADTEIATTGVINETGVTGDRTGTLSLGGKTCFVAEGGWSSTAAVTEVNPLTNWTSQAERDDGAEINFGYYYNIVGSTDVTFGANQTTTEDFTCLAVAITEVSGSTYTLDADSATYSYTATAAGLEFGRLVDAASATYAYTATDADLSRGLPLPADSAAYAWTANDASLEYTPVGSTYTLAADSAAYAWTATDATLTYVQHYNLDADPAAYAWNAQGTGLEWSGADEAQTPTGGWPISAWQRYKTRDDLRRDREDERRALEITETEQRRLDRVAVKIARRVVKEGLNADRPAVMAAPAFDAVLAALRPTEGMALALADAILARVIWMAEQERADEEAALMALLLEL